MCARFVLGEFMMRRHLLIVALFSIIAFAIFVIYTLTNISSNDGEIVMPLDDVYIHFQYARQLAQGQPYVYNIGDSATSGATSFIYPYILAVGYVVGFQGLNLGLWSMIVGGLALIGAMWAIYRLGCYFEAPQWLTIIIPIVFALTGSVSWHAMSGMETMLMVCFSLWTLLAFIEKRLDLLVIFASLLALTRPEGSIMAAIVVLLAGLRLWFDKAASQKIQKLALLTLPIVAIAVQPTVNFLITGSFSASGSQAKSLLGLIPFDEELVFIRIATNVVRLWVEFFTGYSATQDLFYLIILTVPIGIIGILFLLRQREHRVTALLILLWLGSVSAAISTLDTAFWHFKRYQMPLMILFIPLWFIPIAYLLRRFKPLRWIIYGFVIVGLPWAMLSFTSFLTAYQVNIGYVRDQPLAMARWLSENTPDDAIIAVHDVGMMRYIGDRKTLDIVGLTTPDAVQYWRNGVGSVAEFLMKQQPDYIASYGRGHGYGLYMLEETRIYDQPLAEFTVNLDMRLNVALAADKQAIYQPDWEAIITPDTQSAEVLFEVNVADIDSEIAANYAWEMNSYPAFFATAVHDLTILGCDTSHSQSCISIEGARWLSGGERFTVNLDTRDLTGDVLLVSRVHPVNDTSIEVFVNDTLVDTQWIPDAPGNWLDIYTRIPQQLLEKTSVIRIIPNLESGEMYVPAHHQIIVDVDNTTATPEQTIAKFQDDQLMLTDFNFIQSTSEISVTLDWYSTGKTTGDYRFFAHLYNDVNQPPVAQWDNYLSNGMLPLGNWLQGKRQDIISLNIDTLVAGDYQLMIGFYDSATFDRLLPKSSSDIVEILDDGRLILKSVEIK